MADDAEILYDFITYAEWPQEPEIIVKRDEWVTKKHVQSAKNALRSIVGSIGGCIPTEVSRHTNYQLNWQYAVGGNGKVVCILQEACVEIRSSKDDYSSIVGKFNVIKDPFPHWRRLAWSPDCGMLVLSYSDGSIDCFDALGSRLFSVPSKSTSLVDLGEALAAILFVDRRTQKSQWSCEVLLINYKGNLRSYLVSPTDGFQESHSFSFCSYFSSGVTSAIYHPKYNVLLISGQVSTSCSDSEGEIGSAARCGLAMWRVLSDMPFYRLSLTLDEETRRNNLPQNLLKRFPSMVWYRSGKLDSIFKICLSPNGSLLAAIHVSGTLSIWNIPSLRLNKMWSLEEQPDFQSENPSCYGFDVRKKKAHVVPSSLKDHLVDVNWWSDEAVILGRYSGSVSVSSVNNLKNLLGTSLEWFDSPPQVSVTYDRGFLVMECESEIITKRRSASPDDIVLNDATAAIDDDEDSDESDGDDDSFIRKSSRFAKTALYFMTDNERFRPPKKKPKVLKKTFRLLCLKATTPEELFARKLDNEEYGEAISLAHSYGLDSDLVYQCQWRNSEVSVASIQDYLSKITKRTWVLRECLERVPKDIVSARALLNYGLQGTDLGALISIGNKTDGGRFIVCDSQHSYEDFGDVSNETTLHLRGISQKKSQDALLAQIDFSNLTPDQKQLCYSRQLLLRYLDRLFTYETMLGGPAIADEYFDFNFFHTFRSQPSVEAAVQFAHQSNWQSLAAMFTYHGEETLPHRLAILWNFPETVSPFVYRSVLPECGYGVEDPAVVPWEQEIIREKDWVESHFQRYHSVQPTPSVTYLYETNPLLEKFNCSNVTQELLTIWYSERAIDIERQSRLVNNALEIIKLGMERNVQGLEKLHDDFVTMEVLVYECYIDDEITFENLQSMNKLDVIHLMMAMSSESVSVKNWRRWVIPYLGRCAKHDLCDPEELLERYLMSLAMHDMTVCVKIFQNLSTEPLDLFSCPMSTLVRMALSCIYACQADDQLSKANAILECFPQRGFGAQTKEIVGLHDKLDVLEKHLKAAEILEKHGVKKPVAYIKICQNDAEETKRLLTLLARSASRKDAPLSEMQWTELFEDILELQADVLQCVDVDFCVEIFAESLLCSGRQENICLVGGLLKSSKLLSGDKETNPCSSLVPFGHQICNERANALVIKAAEEYFNSSASFSDPSMDLAKQCLLLVHEPNSHVLAELDFINSLVILKHFGIPLLPIQVRLCENRLDLVKQVFKTCPDAYKESQKLLSLAHFLRVGQDVREWEEQVYILMASAALSARDYTACYRSCQCLITHKYSSGWEVCWELGQCDSFENVEARCQLLAFSEIYCLDNSLERVVAVKQKLERRLLENKLQALIDLADAMKSSLKQQSYSSDSMANETDDFSWKTKNVTSHLHRYTSKTTKRVLSIVGKTEVFKQAVSWVHSVWHLKHLPNLSELPGVNNELYRLTCPEFYASVLLNMLASPLMPTYNSYGPPEEVDICLSLGFLIIRLALMENDFADENNYFSHKVLQQVSENLLVKDSPLGLAHLLALDDPVLIDECFSKFPITGTSLQLAMYCFGLKICHLVQLVPKSKLYVYSPQTIIKRAIRFAQTRTSVKCDRNVPKCCRYLLHYERQWMDYIQGRLLLSLGRGVDVARFSKDDQYKHETVLGLIMTTEDKVYDIALTLARKYHIPLWEVYMSHLEYLFAEENMDPKDISSRVTNLGILQILFQDPQKFVARMESVVCASISGLDHSRLLYYYSLLEKCSPKENMYHNHIVLLRKLKEHGQGLNYKTVTDGSHDVLNSLSPVLTGNNVQTFAKLASQLSKCCKQTVEVSMIYRTWAKRLFFGKDSDDNSTVAPHEWLTRYNASKDYFEKFKPRDLTLFIKETLFVDKALDQVPVSIRKEVLQRTTAYAKHEFGKCKEQSKLWSEWEQVLDFCHMALEHLEWVHCKLIELSDVPHNDVLQQFIRALDLSLSNAEEVKTLMYQCVMDGHSLATLERVIDMCPPQLREHPGKIVVKILSIIQTNLRNVSIKYDLLQNRDCIQILEAIIDTIKAHKDNGGNLVCIKDVFYQLQPLCTDISVEASVKLQVIRMMEKIYSDNDAELETLSLYKTQAIIAGNWPEIELLPDKIKNDEFREEMILQLLCRCTTLRQLNALVDLLLCWPSLPSTLISNPEENFWCKIMNSMLEITDSTKLDSVINVFRKIDSGTTLSTECLESLLMKVIERGTLPQSLKFALLAPCHRLHEIVMMEVTKINKDSGISLDDEICLLLLQHKLVSRTVPTVLYQPLVIYILGHESPASIKEIVKDLKEHGFYCEAASLFIMSTGVPRSLTTFYTATGLLKV